MPAVSTRRIPPVSQLPYHDLALPPPVQAALRSQLASLLPDPSPSAVSYGLVDLRAIPERGGECELVFSAAASGASAGALPPHVVLRAACGPAGPQKGKHEGGSDG